MKTITRTFLLTLSVIIMLAIQAATAATKTAAKATAEPAAATDADANGKSNVNDEDINRFTNTIVLIKDFYVKSTADKSILNDAIKGMVAGLDPHSEYLDTDEYKALLTTTSGKFGGVGIEVTPEFGIIKIVAPIDDTPAAKAGIKAGDYIVAIDGKLVSEMTMQESVDHMRGKAGSPITLTVLRKGEKTPLVFKMNREIINVASIKSKMLDNNFGYVRITQFQEPTGKLLEEAILKLKKDNKGRLDGIILDLRNNPGGLLESAVAVSEQFLDSKHLNNKYNNLIVYTEGRLPEAQYSAKASGSDILNGAPIVLLINEGSASASEIVAGALQDYKRAIVVGTTSFGKGSVQTVIPLDKDHAVKLTTALYHTPSGRVIQNVGIIPDVMIADLKVVSNTEKQDLSMLEPIKEYQLKNHLPGDIKNLTEPVELTDQNDAGLAKDDFQLYEAFKVLKTMYMLSPKVMAKNGN